MRTLLIIAMAIVLLVLLSPLIAFLFTEILFAGAVVVGIFR